MWVSVAFLAVFTALWSMASLWLRRQGSTHAAEPAHHAAPRRATWRRHANA